MRMSRMFLRTLRDDPADAEVPSHRLLVRAGYVRRVAPGIYSWLPLGLKVLANVERIIREEMESIGSQEVRFPALLPREPYEVSGRWTDYGPNVFRLKDRKGNDMMLGPTHEEFFTLLVKDLYSSYKDLPLSLYQIQTKYRDEARPRAGILRGREFIMKDSYSFDIDDAGLAASYQAHREAYVRIFERLGRQRKDDNSAGNLVDAVDNPNLIKLLFQCFYKIGRILVPALRQDGKSRRFVDDQYMFVLVNDIHT